MPIGGGPIGRGGIPAIGGGAPIGIGPPLPICARDAATCITSHHITSHHITSHHITSHHITSHHITSHHITSYHMSFENQKHIAVSITS
jgi:hypothetical protein